jgi:hypothetical protein
MRMTDIDRIHTGSEVCRLNLIRRIRQELGLANVPDGRKLEDVIKA